MGTREIASKEIGKFNIDSDLVYIVDKNNFGWTSDDDTISVATANETGGIQLYSSSEARSGIIDELAQTYAVQIKNEQTPKAFVYVPWINSQYLIRDVNSDVSSPINENGPELSLYVEESDIVTHAGRLISTLGYLNIDHVNVKKITGAGDLLSVYEKDITSRITTPLCSEISTLRDDIYDALNLHISSNENDFYNISNCISTSQKKLSIEIRNLSTSLSIDVDVLRDDAFNTINKLCTIEDCNPSYFKKRVYTKPEVNNIITDLSNTICSDYMYRYESYLCSETSSSEELKNKFNSKQDNLSVRTSINALYNNEIDVPTVKAVQDFVNSSIQTNTATFRGSYDSLKDVPTDGTRYIGGKPDLNDYMFVDITDDTTGAWRESLKHLEKGTWRFKYVCNELSKTANHDRHSCWDVTGIGGWYEEYLIDDTMFTDAQKKALNSGITDYLVSLIMSYPTLKAKLTADYPNINATFGNLAYLNEITDNITGKGTDGKLAVFNGANAIKATDISPKAELWQFTLVDGTLITKNVIVSE